MSKFEQQKKLWDYNADKNAKWAISSHTEKLNEEWNTEDFYAEGEAVISQIMQKVESLTELNKELALDFGCGIGRLSKHLGPFFNEVYGIDISESMIQQAKLENHAENIQFLVSESTNLEALGSKKFDFIISLIVIQHIPPPLAIKQLEVLFHKLASGGICVIQIPEVRIPTVKNRIRKYIPEKVFRLKHQLLRPEVPYITMYGLDRSLIKDLSAKNSIEILHIESDRLAGGDWESYTYFLKKV